MSSRSDEPVYHAVWPRSSSGVQARRRADRLPSLDGARIAFLWDYLFRGDELFPVLEAELRERFPGVDIVGYDVFGNLHGSDEKAAPGDCPMICGRAAWMRSFPAWGVEAPARPP